MNDVSPPDKSGDTRGQLQRRRNRPSLHKLLMQFVGAQPVITSKPRVSHAQRSWRSFFLQMVHAVPFRRAGLILLREVRYFILYFIGNSTTDLIYNISLAFVVLCGCYYISLEIHAKVPFEFLAIIGSWLVILMSIAIGYSFHCFKHAYLHRSHHHPRTRLRALSNRVDVNTVNSDKVKTPLMGNNETITESSTLIGTPASQENNDMSASLLRIHNKSKASTSTSSSSSHHRTSSFDQQSFKQTSTSSKQSISSKPKLKDNPNEQYFIVAETVEADSSSSPNWILRHKVSVLVSLVLIGLGVPCYFYATALSIYQLPSWDAELVKADTFLLGNFFPYGQLSLYLDTNDRFGPHTLPSRLLTEVLQSVYFTYYFWPYLVALFPILKCLLELLDIKLYNRTNEERFQNWQKLRTVGTVWALSYLFTFTLNTFFPATSPRLYFSEKYTRPISGLGLAEHIQEMAKENRSANSFPSGHVAETFAAGLSAFFLLQQRVFGGILLGFTFLMCAATVFLRYHYFVDVVAGLIVGTSAFLIGFVSYEMGEWSFAKKKKEKEKASKSKKDSDKENENTKKSSKENTPNSDSCGVVDEQKKCSNEGSPLISHSRSSSFNHHSHRSSLFTISTPKDSAIDDEKESKNDKNLTSDEPNSTDSMRSIELEQWLKAKSSPSSSSSSLTNPQSSISSTRNRRDYIGKKNTNESTKHSQLTEL